MSILLSRAGATQCRWFVCDAVDPPPARTGTMPDLFRGRRVCGAPVSGPTSYCAEHRLRVHDSAALPAPPADFTVAHRAPSPDLQPELTEIFG